MSDVHAAVLPRARSGCRLGASSRYAPALLRVAPHPLLELHAFVAEYPRALADCPTPEWLAAGFGLDAAVTEGAGVSAPDDAVRKAVRALLRHGGFRPSGRSKPASEFLLRAATREQLGSINLAVDLCNVASLHSGLPISVVDLARVRAPLQVDLAEPGSSYVFNPSGQVIALDGLLCLHDEDGPCANAVKDSQRSKTHAETRRTLCVVWGSAELGERSAATARWYRALHERAGVSVQACPIEGG